MESLNWGYIHLGLVKGAVPPLGTTGNYAGSA
jgi:hypothetical protein